MSTTSRHESIAQEARHLEQVAKAGESDETPLILIGGMWLFSAVVVLAVLAITLAAVRIAT